MGRRKICRTPEEEIEFQEQQKKKRCEIQRRYRQAKKNNNSISQNIQLYNNSNSLIPLSIDNASHNVNLISYGPLSNQERLENYRRRLRGENLFSYDLIANINTITEHYGGTMSEFCIHCEAKHFKSEKVINKANSFNDCCNHGRVTLDSFPETPNELRSLFDGTHNKSQEFFNHIRRYNSLFSFASFNANLLNFNEKRPGPYCFRIQGQIYYLINTSLYPSPNKFPTNGQLFIFDSEEGINYLQTQDTSLDRAVLEIIDKVIREKNVFAQSYQMMGEELQNQQLNNDNIPNELFLMFTLKPGLDRRRYNEQRSNEVAAIFSTNADGEVPDSYVTIRNKNTEELQIVSSMDPNVEPWIYPLFYPYGTQGWHANMRTSNSSKRISRSAYTKYLMSNRDNNSNLILMGRRLFQQWIVDQFVKVEKDRTEYIRINQSKIRAESYAGLLDYLNNTATNTNTRVGKVIVLPTTFTGSPRYMMQNYQDAMAMVRKFGKPDLFITMTCNPKWKEITENLYPNQQPSDRPDLTARVFDIKKKHLIDLIVKQKFFGEVTAYVYTIESQKRGLLHIHLLVTLERKLNTPELIDKYISAEIPDQELYPVLHKIIMKNMIHGPCGDWCKINNKCSKYFPKEFNEETTIDENGYPKYRRRNTGITYHRTREHVVDNKWVVPYCPVLSLIFNCHINMEVVATSNAPKYIYKYIFKGHDAAAIDISTNNNENLINHDEIKDHIQARYVGPNEAVWRILDKKIQEKSHSIVRLPVHLPNEQSIRFSEDNINNDNNIREAINRATMLVEYFALNLRDKRAHHFTYSEIPLHYVFKKLPNEQKSQWHKRERFTDTIGRMYSISPSRKELFHLRLLLLRVKAATSFENLRTVNGQIYETFTETCLELGLIEDDNEWLKAMEEASVWMMPCRLRNLFVRILVHCNPVYPEKLWEEFKEKLSEDYQRYMSSPEAHKKAYARIIGLLNTEGYNINQFPTMEQIEFSEEITPELSLAEYMETGILLYNKLNVSQKKIVDKILHLIDMDDHHDDNINDEDNNIITNCYYIDGPGGTGKTFIYSVLFNLIKGRGKCVSTMAFTGIAATLLPQGKTIHKTFGLPVPLYSDSTSNLTIQSKQANYLKNVDLFIWDEAPMAPRYALELIDRTLKDFMNNDKPFGGKIFILGGDFRQLLPIKLHGTRTEIVDLSIKHSFLWNQFSIHSLTQNMRVEPHEIEFAKFLLDVGNGNLNDQNDNLQITDSWLAPHNSNIVEDTYSSLINNKKYEEMATSAILSARNVDVDDINSQVINLLDINSERIYTSIDTIENDSNNEFSEAILPEYLNTLSPRCLPPYELRLRKHAIIMLIRNLSINEGLCNGTRLMILEFGNNVLQCKLLSGDRKGEIVFLNRISLYSENDYPFTFKRRQFPIRIAFAMTINKAQGQTFEKIALDLRRDVFSHGQLYVAFSRVRSSEALKVYLDENRKNDLVKNYVYKEILA